MVVSFTGLDVYQSIILFMLFFMPAPDWMMMYAAKGADLRA